MSSDLINLQVVTRNHVYLTNGKMINKIVRKNNKSPIPLIFIDSTFLDFNI